MKKSMFFLLLFSINYNYTYAQSNIVIEDHDHILNDTIRQKISMEFEKINIALTSMVDFSSTCDYFFGSISKSETNLILSVRDCKHNTIGTKNLEKSLLSEPANDQAIMYFYNFKSIINHPNSTSDSLQSTSSKSEEMDFSNTEHDSRYFFAPSAFPLKKNEFYYNTVYFTLHDIQMGLSDNFTAGLGSTIFGFPMYLTGKLSFNLSEKTNMAIGDMAIIGTYGTKFFGNMTYASITQGSQSLNFTASIGYMTITESDFADKSETMLLNFAAIVPASDRVSLVTENYIFGFDEKYSTYSYPSGNDFNVHKDIWFGITGIRIIRKTNDLICWQFGMAHVFVIPDDVPSNYLDDYWGETSSTLYAFPMFSYTQKFSLK